MYLSIYLSIDPSIHASIDLSIYRSIDLSINLSIYLSMFLALGLSPGPEWRLRGAGEKHATWPNGPPALMPSSAPFKGDTQNGSFH